MVSSDNQFVYVLSGSADSLAAFERDSDNGQLSFAQVSRGQVGLDSPSSLTGGSDGVVYVSSNTALGLDAGGLAAFTRVPPTGATEVTTFNIGHENLETLNLTSGVGDDTVRQINPATVDDLTISTENGFDNVHLLNVAGATNVNTGAGDDRILARSATNGADVVLAIDAGADNDYVTLIGMATDNVVSIDLGDGDDIAQVDGDDLAAGTIVILKGEEGRDWFMGDDDDDKIKDKQLDEVFTDLDLLNLI
jgi:hypothetical protein